MTARQHIGNAIILLVGFTPLALVIYFAVRDRMLGVVMWAMLGTCTFIALLLLGLWLRYGT